MNILIVCLSKLPARLYGGTERVVWSLAKELTRIRGERNRVFILAKAGSTCDFAKIIERNPAVPLETQIPVNVDVVHFQDVVPTGFSAKPYIVTLNGNRISEPIDRNAVFVSRNHAERFGSKSFVYNGLDWDAYGHLNTKEPRRYFHFLGKAAWRVKNVRGSISMIKRMDANERLYILGGYALISRWAGVSLSLRRRVSRAWSAERKRSATFNIQEVCCSLYCGTSLSGWP